MGTETIHSKDCPFAMEYDNSKHTFYFVFDPFGVIGPPKRVAATPTDWLLFNIWAKLEYPKKSPGLMERILG